MSKPKIRVAFLLFYFEAWDALAGIHREMLHDARFEVTVFSSPRKLTGDSSYGSETAVHRFLDKHDIAHVRLEGNDYEASLNKLRSFEPDYVFLNYPWQRNYPPALRADRLTEFTRIAYVPYFLLPLVNEENTSVSDDESSFNVAGHLYEQRTHQLASLVFVQDKDTKAAFAATSRGSTNVFDYGSTKLDELRIEYESYLKLGKRAKYDLRVLWAPHHSYSEKWLGFGRFAKDYEDFLEFARRNPRIKITLRPHPFLFGTLVDRGLLTQDQLDDWLSSWNELPNTRLTKRAPFTKQFAKTDLLVTDGISFLAEYPLLTGKPGLFLENPTHWRFTRIGKLAAECNRTINSVSALDEVALALTQDPHHKLVDDFDMALESLRQAVDPNPGVVSGLVVDAVATHFAGNPPLVNKESIADVPWEDRAGREPRTD